MIGKQIAGVCKHGLSPDPKPRPQSGATLVVPVGAGPGSPNPPSFGIHGV
jgi:hypothetical protein